MPGTVVYYSKTGNTKKIAEAVARGAGAKCLSVESARGVKGELFFVGTPLRWLGPSKPILEFLRGRDWSGERVALFCTYLSVGEKRALKVMREEVENRGGKVVGEFSCRGRLTPEGERRAEEFGKRVARLAVRA
jgi:flavodoxin